MDLTAMIEKMRLEKNIVRDIILTKDTERLIASDDSVCDQFFSAMVYDVFQSKKYSELNDLQRNIYLCRNISDKTETGGLLAITRDDELYALLPRAAEAFEAIGAVNTAALINRFMALIPPEMTQSGSLPEAEWFLNDKDRKIKFDNIDSAITSHPDGKLSVLFKKAVLTADNPSDIFA